LPAGQIAQLALDDDDVDDDAFDSSQILMLPVSKELCTLAHVGNGAKTGSEIDSDSLPDVEASPVCLSLFSAAVLFASFCSMSSDTISFPTVKLAGGGKDKDGFLPKSIVSNARGDCPDESTVVLKKDVKATSDDHDVKLLPLRSRKDNCSNGIPARGDRSVRLMSLRSKSVTRTI
jgi:hypothetical protein